MVDIAPPMAVLPMPEMSVNWVPSWFQLAMVWLIGDVTRAAHLADSATHLLLGVLDDGILCGREDRAQAGDGERQVDDLVDRREAVVGRVEQGLTFGVAAAISECAPMAVRIDAPMPS